MNEVFALLETVEMGEWVAYGRSTLAQGRIRPMDFSSRSANPFGITGVNAIARFEDMTIYVDVTMWQVMPVRLLADVMLDEMAHFFYHTTEHHEYHRLRYQLTTTWEAKFGKPWGYYGTEEQLWNDYLDNPDSFTDRERWPFPAIGHRSTPHGGSGSPARSPSSHSRARRRLPRHRRHRQQTADAAGYHRRRVRQPAGHRPERISPRRGPPMTNTMLNAATRPRSRSGVTSWRMVAA